MRERVYLSQRKLAAIRDSNSSSGYLRHVHVRSARGVPPPSVPRSPYHELRMAENAQLRQIVAETEMAARRFDEPDVIAGEWVRFDTPLNSAVIDLAAWGHHELGGELLLFWTPAQLTTQLERLVLVASPDGMLDESLRPPAVERPEAAMHSYRGLFPLLTRLAHAGSDPAPEFRPLLQEVALLDQACAEIGYDDTQQYFGYARVLANAAARSWGRPQPHSRRCIAASPLYIEYSD